jgi:hypothetical protein
MKKVADIVNVDGTIERLPTTVAKMKLGRIQEILGGYVEHAMGIGRTELWCNEEGLLHNLPYNSIASQRTGHHVVGNAIVESWE